jgi:two-component system, OmpR family, phosphate regulon sensor histidine kinase PhoR
MPEILLNTLLVLLLIGLGAVLWRYRDLQRRLDNLSQIVRQTAQGDWSVLNLPENERRLEDLSNAVRSLALAQQAQLADLEDQRARLADVLDQMTDGVLIVNPEGRVMLINPAAQRMFNIRAKEPQGRSVTEILRHHVLVQTWQRCYESGQPQSEAVEMPARRQFLQISVIPDRLVPGGSLIFLQDLTRVRRLETVRRDFISNLSHELRTPLASLKALTETLSEGALDDPPAARRFLARMETEVDALTQMTNELLELTKIESGKVPLDLKPLAPDLLLLSVSERMSMQIERARLSLNLNAADSLPLIIADFARLEQVLVNLIHNAVKFTPPGGQIRLEVAPDEKSVRFSVGDTGAGIPADILPRIFERFYKADRARSSGGTGLGLSIARHIVEAHGGRIWAESEENQGSTFSFTIPQSSPDWNKP